APNNRRNMEVAEIRHVLDVHKDAHSTRTSGERRRRRPVQPRDKEQAQAIQRGPLVHQDGLFHAALGKQLAAPFEALTLAGEAYADGCGVQGNGKHSYLHRRPCAGSTQRYVLTPLNARMRWRINYSTEYCVLLVVTDQQIGDGDPDL